MKKKPDGGPSAYYDFDGSYQTVNDILEDKSEKQWREHAWHLSNIFKAVWRWGVKDGTTMEYDAKKIIYSGSRILRRMVGTQKTREYLQELLDDKQFQVSIDYNDETLKCSMCNYELGSLVALYNNKPICGNCIGEVNDETRYLRNSAE